MTTEIFEIEREFDAPISTVWRAWSEPELVSIWYGPGVETIMHTFEFEEGGHWHEEMKMGENSMHGRTEFVQIIPEKKLVLRQSSADENGNVIDNPMMPNWPRVMEAVVIFEEVNGKTKMTFTWAPHDASDAEKAMFQQMADRMGGGWNSGFDIMQSEISKL